LQKVGKAYWYLNTLGHQKKTWGKGGTQVIQTLWCWGVKSVQKKEEKGKLAQLEDQRWISIPCLGTFMRYCEKGKWGEKKRREKKRRGRRMAHSLETSDWDRDGVQRDFPRGNF